MCFVSQFSSLVNDYSLLTLFCSLKIFTRKEESPNRGEERRGEENIITQNPNFKILIFHNTFIANNHNFFPFNGVTKTPQQQQQHINLGS